METIVSKLKQQREELLREFNAISNDRYRPGTVDFNAMTLKRENLQGQIQALTRVIALFEKDE